MDLRMKATLLVAIVSFLQADHSCCRLLETLGINSVVQMRNGNGSLTRQGQMVMSLFFALLTYTVMSAGRK